eukprot:Colp12_sorted_trinity150504_noHs@16271
MPASVTDETEAPAPVVKAAEQEQSRNDAFLLSEICNGDSQLCSALRAVYDEGKHESFYQSLTSFIAKQDQEIERLCGFHYQGFFESVQRLLTVVKDASSLNDMLHVANNTLQKSGNEVINASEELMQHRQTLKNISIAVETLHSCLPALRLYGNAETHAHNKKYYSALKCLEQLEKDHLPLVMRHSFAKLLEERLPLLRRKIKFAVRSELQDWLEKIMKESGQIGKSAMESARKQQLLSNEDVFAIGTIRWAVPGRLRGDSMIGRGESLRQFEVDSGVSYAPVYRCLHIYDVLGVRDEFKGYYKDARDQQASLLLQPVSHEGSDFKTYERYFQQIMGFFVVESTILNGTDNLLSRGAVDEMWSAALDKLHSVLHVQLSLCHDATLLLDIKEFLGLFFFTAQEYGYNVGRLQELLVELRVRFEELLVLQWAAKFDAILQADKSEPLQVEDQEILEDVLKLVPCKDVHGAEFPLQLPFSDSVPELAKSLREYILAILRFADNLNLSQGDVEDVVRKSINTLVTTTLHSSLLAAIRNSSQMIWQLVQISINIQYIEDACMQLEGVISELTSSGVVGTAPAGKLQGISTFREVRAFAEDIILRLVREKIDGFVDVAEYSWVASKNATEPSDYINDLLGYVRTLFTSLSNLPPDVAQMMYFEATNHMATSLYQLITGDSFKFMNAHGLSQFDLDVQECEQFAATSPVPHLQNSYVQLRQLIDLLRSENWDALLVPETRQKLYARVPIAVAIKLLEKCRDEADSGLFSRFRSAGRERREKIENTLKGLRALQQARSTPAK